MNDYLDTTRRYARSLSEAFADERACAVWHFQAKSNRAVWITLIGAAVFLALLFFVEAT